MMKQYLDIKREHPGDLLLFRMGDFYESFFDDAREVSSILGITLTSREKSGDDGEGIPLAGFPHHALDGYLARLVRAGRRVAICEQVEDPSKARGLVRREVVEVVTPGTLVSGSALDDRRTLLLASAWSEGASGALAVCDLSTGAVEATAVPAGELMLEAARREPTELLVAEGAGEQVPEGVAVTELEGWKFDPDLAEENLREMLGLAKIEGVGLKRDSALLCAVGGLLAYVADTKRSVISHLCFEGVYDPSDSMIIDRRSAVSLAISRAPEGEEASVLADATDMTVTAAGSREWRSWLLAPPRDPDAVLARHDAVEWLAGFDGLEDLRSILRDCADLLRQSGKLGTRRSSPRDLDAIRRTAALLPGILSTLPRDSGGALTGLAAADRLRDVEDAIASTLADDPPARLSDGGVIGAGVSEELDRLRDIRSGGREWIHGLRESERERTGIPNLSIGFNKVFGYYIEVSKSHLEKVPDDYTRKQTLVGGERFVTPELKEMESRVLRAEEEAAVLEERLFSGLRDRVAAEVDRIRATGRALAQLDALCGLAAMAGERGYVRPELCREPLLDIRSGHHPVLERLLPRGQCVPNDLLLSGERRILLVTGPNMAGKSTYLRQAALLVVMAQAGSYVPASSMRFSTVDRIFTRIGSSDRITRGESTFLVEMSEAASLLNTCTERSLAILDEVGRGTSTFDGLSLAWAMLEYLHDHRRHRPLVLFATHYHELVALADRLPAADNVNVAVRESGDGVAFLYRVEKGGTDRSYGIHVASMAGVPPAVVRRAGDVLKDLEAGRHLRHGGDLDQLELPLEEPAAVSDPALEEIRRLDPDGMTPREALDVLYRLRDLTGDGGGLDPGPSGAKRN
jgi:DNA mismatch repair protein MutS